MDVLGFLVWTFLLMIGGFTMGFYFCVFYYICNMEHDTTDCDTMEDDWDNLSNSF